MLILGSSSIHQSLGAQLGRIPPGGSRLHLQKQQLSAANLWSLSVPTMNCIENHTLRVSLFHYVPLFLQENCDRSDFSKFPQTFTDFYKTWRGIESTFNWTHPKLKQLIPLLLHALLLMHSNAIFTSLGFYQQFALASLTDSLTIFRPTRAVTHWNPLTQNWGVVTRCKTGNHPTEINAPSTARCKHSLCSSKMYNQKTLAPTSLYLSKWKIWTRSNHSHKPTQIMWRLQAGTTKQANIQAIASAHSITIGYNWIQLAHIQDSTSWCQECISLVKKSQNGRWT